ncbi:MAG: hypothetical protein LUQ31_08125 [Methanoregula sp.]|nr:hypothetical protein [Methanoregula sp.]
MAKKAAAPRTPARLRTITLEEHYASPTFLDGPDQDLLFGETGLIM